VLLHVVTVRGLGDMTDPAHRLAQAVRRAAEARGDGDPSDLRVALVELAAVAMDWAAAID
jgi:hypothetical protein